MKKLLLACSAIVATGAIAVPAAQAAEPLTASVNGYMQGGVAFRDGEDTMGVLRDGEIHFNVSGASDNGLTFGARVELEVATGNDQIDENYLTIGTEFATLKIGSDDSAKNAYANGIIYSPGARIGYFDGFGDVNGVFQPGLRAAFDAPGVHIDSANFSGFQVGFTYIPNTGADGDNDWTDVNGDGVNDDVNNDTGSPSFGDGRGGGQDNFFAVGAVYEADFDGFGVGISGAFGASDRTDSEVWHVGGNVGFAGFTLAAHYEGAEGQDDAYAFGASYGTGPWTVAGGYTFADGSNSDPYVIAGWVSYALAPGVTVAGGLEYGDDDAGTDKLGGLAWIVLGF